MQTQDCFGGLFKTPPYLRISGGNMFLCLPGVSYWLSQSRTTLGKEVGQNKVKVLVCSRVFRNESIHSTCIYRVPAVGQASQKGCNIEWCTKQRWFFPARGLQSSEAADGREAKKQMITNNNWCFEGNKATRSHFLVI